MSRFTDNMREAGVAELRAYELESAVGMLHTVLCRLDENGRDAVAKTGIHTILRQYAIDGYYRDVASELQEIGVAKAVERTDLSGEVDIQLIMDRLYNALLDFMELGLPGAYVCWSSLLQYRELVNNKRFIQPKNADEVQLWLENNVSPAWYVITRRSETYVGRTVTLKLDASTAHLIIHKDSVSLYQRIEGEPDLSSAPMIEWQLDENPTQLMLHLTKHVKGWKSAWIAEIMRIAYGLKL